MATRRSVTTISEAPYQEGDVLVKSTNGLPTYGMTEADMQNMQLAAQQQAAAQAQRTADIVNAARSGSITYGGNQGGAVTYGGGQGGVTILPDIRRDGDGVWLANMAPGRPIDLGPTAGWSGFNGQGQFVGFPSGMPHVLYGGFMDTLAPFMQYLAPMFQQARGVVQQGGIASAPVSKTPRTRAAKTTGDVLGALANADQGVSYDTTVSPVAEDVLGALANADQGVPGSDIDWSTAIGTGGTDGFTGEIQDVSPEVANNAMTALSLLSLLMGGGFFGSLAKLGSRLFGGASKAKQALSNIDKLSRVMQPNITSAERAANAARIQNLVGGRAPTVVRRDNIVTPQPIIRPIR